MFSKIIIIFLFYINSFESHLVSPTWKFHIPEFYALNMSLFFQNVWHWYGFRFFLFYPVFNNIINHIYVTFIFSHYQHPMARMYIVSMTEYNAVPRKFHCKYFAHFFKLECELKTESRSALIEMWRYFVIEKSTSSYQLCFYYSQNEN